MKTHDYTIRTWGHDYTISKIIDGGKMIEMAGWGSGIKVGHFLLLPNGSDTTRYRIVKIRYCSDPHDMWFATAAFDPRPEPILRKEIASTSGV